MQETDTKVNKYNLFIRILKSLRFLAGIALRPRVSYFRYREKRRINYYKNKKLQLHPIKYTNEIRIVPIKENISLKKIIVKIYKNNPSPLTISPKKMKSLDKEMHYGTEYFLIKNLSLGFIGAIGFRKHQSTIVHVVIDHNFRHNGYGISSIIAFESYLKKKSIIKTFVNVYKINTKAMNTFLSLDYIIEKKNPKLEYITLSKILI